MIFVLLRRGDGLRSGRAWLGSVVRNLQLGLAQAGHSVSTDGKFGSGTEDAVKAFQRGQGINESGIVDKPTWAALARHLRAAIGLAQEETQKLLNGFAGDLDWVHEREGHRGTAYWPGGASGVTLDPGVDLGHVDSALIDRLYGPLLSADQCLAAKKCLGLKGDTAKAALSADPILETIRIKREDAERLMPFAAESYWKKIAARFPLVSTPGTLPSVQTVFLSLAYNRGAGNSDLDQLKSSLDRAEWAEVADRVGAMQQDHELEGIRVRRRDEANLIRAELEYANT
jgi:GH24 family phage-related lysozyme (muramidase)